MQKQKKGEADVLFRVMVEEHEITSVEDNGSIV
jgi:hypothetical protein